MLQDQFNGARTRVPLKQSWAKSMEVFLPKTVPMSWKDCRMIMLEAQSKKLMERIFPERYSAGTRHQQRSTPVFERDRGMQLAALILALRQVIDKTGR